MQTFLPYADLTESLRVLDNKRLGKQRVETYQIISAITGRLKLDGTPYKGWINHPCSVMWRNHVPLLKMYLNASIDEWVKRGFKNTMDKEAIDFAIRQIEVIRELLSELSYEQVEPTILFDHSIFNFCLILGKSKSIKVF